MRERNKKKTKAKKVTHIAGKTRRGRKVASSADVPATKGMLDQLEQKLTHQITSCRLETKALEARMEARFDQIESRFKLVDSRFNQIESRFKDIDSRFNQIESRFKEIDSRFDQIESRFKEIDSRFHQIDSRFNQMDAKIEMVLAAVHKVALLVEEQNARNKFVLDGYQSLNDRVEKLERRIGEKDV